MLASLIGSLVSGEAVVALRRAKLAAISYVVAGILVAIGIGFLLAVGYMLAARRFGPIEAALGFGGGFILLALIVLGVFWLTTRSQRRRAIERRKGEAAALAVSAALALLPALASKRAGKAMLIAPALAFLGYKIFNENRGRAPEDSDEP